MSDFTTTKTNEAYEGLRVANLDEIAVRFRCMFCQTVLLFPWQLLCCGVLLCKWCLKNGLSNSEPFTCPYCQVVQAKKEARPDRGAERELKTIIVLCYLCTWNGLYKDYLVFNFVFRDHLRDVHAVFECVDCNEHFLARNLLLEHRQDLCNYRCLPCGLPGCATSIAWDDMKAHYLSDQHQHILLSIAASHINPQRQQLQINNRFETIQTDYNEFHETADVLLTALETLSVDQTRLKLEGNEIKTNFEQNLSKVDELKKQADDNNKRLDELCDTQKSLETKLNQLKQVLETNRIRILDINCTTTLPFNNPSTRVFSVDSAKFKTSEYGHMLSLRLCPTVESSQEYLSIFLTLYNGDYANLMSYPFAYDLHFALLDQSNQQKHIQYVLKPDSNSPAFTRPTSEKNPEYGITKFCLLEHLTDTKSIYVRDGIFFIRVFVDFLNTGQNPFSQITNNIEKTDVISTTTMITN